MSLIEWLLIAILITQWITIFNFEGNASNRMLITLTDQALDT